MDTNQITQVPPVLPGRSEHQSTSAARKRAVLYARVSSDDRGKEGRNLKSQLDMCREYALSHGYQIVDELAEDDRGASGASFELPQLARILTMAEAGDMDILVVRELDRLSRNLAKQLIFEEELKRHGVAIEYVLAEYDDTPEGRLQKHIRATIAEYEREKIRERNIRGRRNVVKTGRIMLHGNRPPFGYRVSEDGTNLVIYEPEAQIVRLIFQWYTEGDEKGRKLSAYKIAKRLSEMQTPTWADIHGIFPKKRGYGQWSNTIVLDILHSETYRGYWHYGRRNSSTYKINPREQWLTLKVPAIINDEVWEAAQVQCKQNATEADRNIKREYLMRYRLKCACGYSVHGYCVTCRRKSGRKCVYLYYRCSGVVLDVAQQCDLPSFRVDQVDATIWKWVKDWLQDPVDLARRLEIYQAERDKVNAPTLAQLEIVDSLLQENREQLDRLLDLYLSGTFNKDVLLDHKKRLENIIAKLEQERTRLATQLEQSSLRSDQIGEVISFAAQLSAGLEAADQSFEAKRRVIELLDVRAVLAVENGEKVVYPSLVLSNESEKVRLNISDSTFHFSKCGVCQRASTE